jgi:hypothetical protein
MVRLTQDVLDIHRLETGQAVMEDRSVDLRQLLLHMEEKPFCDGVVFQLVKRSQQECGVPFPGTK